MHNMTPFRPPQRHVGEQHRDCLRSTDSFVFEPSEAGEVHFGVNQVGTWQAQVVVSGTLSNIVVWEVLWLPVHVTR